MKEFKRNYLITALCGTCMLTPALIMAQEAADTTQTHFFNATDYIRQKRYIPAGRSIDPKAKGRNFSFSIFGGVGNLAEKPLRSLQPRSLVSLSPRMFLHSTRTD